MTDAVHDRSCDVIQATSNLSQTPETSPLAQAMQWETLIKHTCSLRFLKLVRSASKKQKNTAELMPLLRARAPTPLRESHLSSFHQTI